MNIRSLILLLCSLSVLSSFAQGVNGRSYHTRIELRYDQQDVETANGNIRRMAIVPYTFFNMTDVFSCDELKVGCEASKDGVTVFDFDIRYPLYDIIQNGGRSKIPFYVEPGDTLIIQVSSSGEATAYITPDGKHSPYENFLLHDISYNRFYTEKDFNSDRRDTHFPQFVDKVVSRMTTSLDSVSLVADKYGFTEGERQLATINVKLQYGTWLFGFPPPKGVSNGAKATANGSKTSKNNKKQKGGEQLLPEQEQALAELRDVNNYTFVRQLPLNDSLCLASRFFPEFMTSYEQSQILTMDQGLYAGNSMSAVARRDSAFIARDRQLTGEGSTSFFMDIALDRRHYEAPSVDDGSIRLADVQVIGSTGQETPIAINAQDVLNAKLNSRKTYDALSPTYWLEERKTRQARKRATRLINQIEAADQRAKEEHDALEKAAKDNKK